MYRQVKFSQFDLTPVLGNVRTKLTEDRLKIEVRGRWIQNAQPAHEEFIFGRYVATCRSNAKGCMTEGLGPQMMIVANSVIIENDT